MTVLAETAPAAESVVVDFDTDPGRYHHWRLAVQGEVATLSLLVDPDAGLVPGYQLKSNSYDLGADIELYDAVQRLRFTYPGVKSVVLTSGVEKMFCAGANITMLAQSSHAWKVNFCKFTNETRNNIEAASAGGGQTWIAALNGTAAGGGYEMALACAEIVLIDDGSSTVSLPEVPLLGVLPGTGGLTRVVDKRHVRKDRADVFATKSEGIRGQTAVAWRLVDETAPRARFDDVVAARARAAAGRSTRPGGATGVELTPLGRTETPTEITYPYVRATLDAVARRVDITVDGPPAGPPPDGEAALAQGVEYWPLAMTRALDDLILRLRTNHADLGTWMIRSSGDPTTVLAHDARLAELAGHWFVDEVQQYYLRTLKRLDVTSRSLIAVVTPGSCFGGLLAELLWACDRQYVLDGVFEDSDDPSYVVGAEAATVTVTAANDGAFPMGNGLSRLASRFYGQDHELTAVRERMGERLPAAELDALGLVTMALDDIDFDDELRIVVEERASLSPDALTGMEANHRFVGPETIETKVFGRLTAWQNWIFNRPNASGSSGALRRFGTGQRADFDTTRV